MKLVFLQVTVYFIDRNSIFIILPIFPSLLILYFFKVWNAKEILQ